MRALLNAGWHSTVRIVHLQSICTSPLVIRFLGGGFLEREILCRGDENRFLLVQYFAMLVEKYGEFITRYLKRESKESIKIIQNSNAEWSWTLLLFIYIFIFLFYWQNVSIIIYLRHHFIVMILYTRCILSSQLHHDQRAYVAKTRRTRRKISKCATLYLCRRHEFRRTFVSLALIQTRSHTQRLYWCDCDVPMLCRGSYRNNNVWSKKTWSYKLVDFLERSSRKS